MSSRKLSSDMDIMHLRYQPAIKVYKWPEMGGLQVRESRNFPYRGSLNARRVQILVETLPFTD